MIDGAVYGHFRVVWVDYYCPNNHSMRMGHGMDNKGRFLSASPTWCHNCGNTYTYAEIKMPKEYFDFRLNFRSAGGTKRKKTLNT